MQIVIFNMSFVNLEIFFFIWSYGNKVNKRLNTYLLICHRKKYFGWGKSLRCLKNCVNYVNENSKRILVASRNTFKISIWKELGEEHIRSLGVILKLNTYNRMNHLLKKDKMFIAKERQIVEGLIIFILFMLHWWKGSSIRTDSVQEPQILGNQRENFIRNHAIRAYIWQQNESKGKKRQGFFMNNGTRTFIFNWLRESLIRTASL